MELNREEIVFLRQICRQPILEMHYCKFLVDLYNKGVIVIEYAGDFFHVRVFPTNKGRDIYNLIESIYTYFDSI